MRKFLGLILIFAFLLVLIVSAFAQSKAVFIVPSSNFQDDELAVPNGIFKDNNINVTIASTTLNEITGMNGSKVKPNILLKDVNVDNFDAVVFIGGSGTTEYIDDPLAQKIAKDAVAKNKILGAICLAPRILANAGVLKNKNATVYPTEGEKLTQAGAFYAASSAVRDGNIITADGPSSAFGFGEILVSALKEGSNE